jgi:hypothetical protein
MSSIWIVNKLLVLVMYSHFTLSLTLLRRFPTRPGLRKKGPS